MFPARPGKPGNRVQPGRGIGRGPRAERVQPNRPPNMQRRMAPNFHAGPRARQAGVPAQPAKKPGLSQLIEKLTTGEKETKEVAPKRQTSFLDQLKNADGHWDINKVMNTGNQLQRMYGQVSPLISKFITKK